MVLMALSLRVLHHTWLLTNHTSLSVCRCCLQDVCQVGSPHLEYDDYAKAKVALDSAKAAMTTLSEENRMLAERLAAAEKEKKQMMERLRV